MKSHIILYADEFDYDVWEDYCEICGVHHSARKITIVFNDEDVKAEYDEDEDEDDFDFEEEPPYDDEDKHYIRSSTNGDYSPSNPWDAPGMSINDFI